MHVGLVTPYQPADVADLLDRPSASVAPRIDGQRAVAVAELTRGLLARGNRVTVATLTYDPESPVGDLCGPGLTIRVARGRQRPRHHLPDIYAAERRGLVALLRDARPDIVHAHWTYEYELAAQDCGLPHVTTARDAPFTILRHVRDPYRAARLAVALRARPRITDLSCVSPYLAARWRGQMGYRRPIEVVPNIVPYEAQVSDRIARDHPTILDIADASERKNVKGLLHAFALVRRSMPDAELRLVGPGLAEGDDLHSWATERRLSSGVTFVGPIDRSGVAAELRGAWLLAHASREESFGITVLEAVGAGIGVLGSRDAGGVPYVLGDGAAGWLTDVDTPAVFARAMTDLLREGPVAPPAGAAEYITRFSREGVTASYSAWYARVLSDREHCRTAA